MGPVPQAEENINSFPLSQANKFIPTFGKKRRLSESCTVQLEKISVNPSYGKAGMANLKEAPKYSETPETGMEKMDIDGVDLAKMELGEDQLKYPDMKGSGDHEKIGVDEKSVSKVKENPQKTENEDEENTMDQVLEVDKRKEMSEHKMEVENIEEKTCGEMEVDKDKDEKVDTEEQNEGTDVKFESIDEVKSAESQRSKASESLDQQSEGENICYNAEEDEKVEFKADQIQNKNVSANNVSANNVSASNVSANNVSANNVSANNVSTNVSTNNVSANVSANIVSTNVSTNMSANDVSTNDVPTNNMPANNVSTNNMSTKNLSTNNVPANNVPANNVPANNMPANNVPANNVSAKSVPANNVPANNMPANNASTNNVSANNVSASNVTESDIRNGELEVNKISTLLPESDSMITTEDTHQATGVCTNHEAELKKDITNILIHSTNPQRDVITTSGISKEISKEKSKSNNSKANF